MISWPAHPLLRQGRSRAAPRASSRPSRDIAPSLTVISRQYRGLRRIALHTDGQQRTPRAGSTPCSTKFRVLAAASRPPAASDWRPAAPTSSAAGGGHLPMRRAASRPRASSEPVVATTGRCAGGHPYQRIERGEPLTARGAHLRQQLAATACWCAGGVPPGASNAAASSTASGWRPAVPPRPAAGGGHLPVRRAVSGYRHAAPPTAGSAAASMSCMTSSRPRQCAHYAPSVTGCKSAPRS